MKKDYETSSLTTTFNMSIQTLMRIDTILQRLDECNCNDNIVIQYRSNYSLYKEIYPFLKDKERTTALNKWDCIKEFIPYLDDGRTKYNINLKPLLCDFEFWLRDQLKITGLLMAQSDDPAEAIYNM